MFTRFFKWAEFSVGYSPTAEHRLDINDVNYNIRCLAQRGETESENVHYPNPHHDGYGEIVEMLLSNYSIIELEDGTLLAETDNDDLEEVVIRPR